MTDDPWATPPPATPAPPGPWQQPPPRRRGWFARHPLVTVLAGSVVLLLVVGGAAESARQRAAGPRATPTSSPPVAGIGAAARDGKFEFTVTRAQFGRGIVGNQYVNAKAQGRYFYVDLDVRNIGDRPQRFAGGSQRLLDGAGREFRSDGKADYLLNEGRTVYEAVNPGNTLSVTLVFDLPRGEVPDRLDLHDSGLSGGVTVSLR